MVIQKKDFRFGKNEFEKDSHEKFFGKSYKATKADALTYGRKVNPLSYAFDSLKIKFNRFNYERKAKESIKEKQISHLSTSIDELLKEADAEKSLNLNQQDIDVDIGVLRNAVIQTQRIIEKLKNAKANKKEIEEVQVKLGKLEMMLESFVKKRKEAGVKPKILINSSLHPKKANASQSKKINASQSSSTFKLPASDINIREVKRSTSSQTPLVREPSSLVSKHSLRTTDDKVHHAALIPAQASEIFPNLSQLIPEKQLKQLESGKASEIQYTFGDLGKDAIYEIGEKRYVQLVEKFGNQPFTIQPGEKRNVFICTLPVSIGEGPPVSYVFEKLDRPRTDKQPIDKKPISLDMRPFFKEMVIKALETAERLKSPDFDEDIQELKELQKTLESGISTDLTKGEWETAVFELIKRVIPTVDFQKSYEKLVKSKMKTFERLEKLDDQYKILKIAFEAEKDPIKKEKINQIIEHFSDSLKIMTLDKNNPKKDHFLKGSDHVSIDVWNKSAKDLVKEIRSDLEKVDKDKDVKTLMPPSELSSQEAAFLFSREPTELDFIAKLIHEGVASEGESIEDKSMVVLKKKPKRKTAAKNTATRAQSHSTKKSIFKVLAVSIGLALAIKSLDSTVKTAALVPPLDIFAQTRISGTPFNHTIIDLNPSTLKAEVSIKSAYRSNEYSRAFSELENMFSKFKEIDANLHPEVADLQADFLKDYKRLRFVNDGTESSNGRLLNFHDDQFEDLIKEISKVAENTKSELNKMGLKENEKIKTKAAQKVIPKVTEEASLPQTPVIDNAILIKSFAMVFFAFILKANLELNLVEKELTQDKARAKAQAEA